MVTDDRSFSWSELASESEQMANSLSAHLPSSKDQLVVGLLLPNGWQFVVAYLAILRLGHIAMPLDPSYKSLELDAIIRQIPPQLTVSNRQYAGNIDSSGLNMAMVEDLAAKSINKAPNTVRLPADKQVASLVFTSGTTGQPKAAPYTHANHIWNIKVCSEVWNWTKDDSLLISLLLSHWYGLVMGLSGALYHANTMYLQDWFDAEKTLEVLSSGKITMFTHISGIYNRLLEVEDYQKYDLSGVRLCISGASALPPAVWQEFKKRFGIEILECYGSSESGRIASNLLDERIPGSPGRPLPGVETKLSSDGELLVRSDGIFPGYWRNPQATKASLTKDGWWHTGDIALIEDGRIVLKGRKQEKIRRYGYSISARDVEWALHQNKAIREVYVLGAQRQNDPNDELIYFIVGNLDEDAVLTYCKQNLPFAWRPDRIVFLSDLPRTQTGKPQMGKLRDLAGVKR